MKNAPPRDMELISAYVWAVMAAVLWLMVAKEIAAFFNDREMALYSLKYYVLHGDLDNLLVAPMRFVAMTWGACFLLCILPFLGYVAVIGMLKRWHRGSFVVGAALIAMLMYCIPSIPHVEIWDRHENVEEPTFWLQHMISLDALTYLIAGLIGGCVCWWRLNNGTKLFNRPR